MCSAIPPRLAAGLCLAVLAAAAGAAPGGLAATCPAGGDGFRSPSAVAHYVEARLAGLRGERSQEAESLRLAVIFDESSAELRAAHAAALLGLGRIDAAEAEARLAVACDPAGRAASLAHRLLGHLLLAEGQPEPALQELRASMAVETALVAAGERGDPEAWRLAAGVRLQARDLDGAEATLEAAVAAVGTDGGGFREMGRTLSERGQEPRAERLLRRAVELDRGDLEAWGLLARVDEALRRPSAARADWLELLRLDPENPEALLGLGRLAVLDGDLPAGEEWFRRYLLEAGDGPEAGVRLALEWLEARRPEQALLAARLGLLEAPGDPRLLLVAGEALQGLQRWGESATTLAQVKPGAGEPWYSARARMAWALSRGGRHDEAQVALAPALAARPDDPALLSLRADLLLRSGHPDEALDGLRQAIADRPGDPALVFSLGAALDEAGRPDEAMAQMRAVLELTPDHAEALNFIGYRYAEQGVNLEEAGALLERALRASPRSGHIVDSLGWLRLRQGDVTGSVALLEQADRLLGPDAEVLDHLGDAYRAAGRAAEAGAAWRRALASLGDPPPAEWAGLRAALEGKLSGLAAVGVEPAAP